MKYLYFTRSNGDIDCLPEKSVIQHKLTTAAKRKAFIGSDDITNIKLQEEVLYPVWNGSEYIKADGKEKELAIDEAEALYKTLKAKRVIDGYDLSDTFEFDFQRKKGGSVRMKKEGGKTETKTKAETDAIEGKLFYYLNSCSDALDADIDAIQAGDFSLSNLKAL
jgi:uncharacterized protein YtpQ (UPF0354 family)